MEILVKIQQGLKAPKGQTNTFGGYKYRSCEDILEAVKPLLGGATLTISDEMVQLGDRYYVKATATLAITAKEKSVTAYAREAENKKGMDAAQITGAASSYARKYALNGLFLIDDTKDADSMDNTAPPAQAKRPVPVAKPITKEAPTSLNPQDDALMAEIADCFKQAKTMIELDFNAKDYGIKIAALPGDSKDWVRGEYIKNFNRLRKDK